MHKFGYWEILVNFFFPYCCRVKVPMNSTAVGKKMIPKAHQMNICCISSFTEGVLLCLLKPGSPPAKAFKGTWSWGHSMRALTLSLCFETHSLWFVFPKSHCSSPGAPHLPFLSQSTTRVHQNIYYKLSEPGTVLQLHIFLFFLSSAALPLNGDVSGETRHSSVHLKWRKINKCGCWTQVKSMAWCRSHVCKESQFCSVDSVLQVWAGSGGGSLFGNRNRTAWSTHNPGI